MLAYILKRLLLIVPTMFGILLVTFLIVQFAPGGPVEHMIARLQGHDVSATSRIGGGSGGDFGAGNTPSPGDVALTSKYRGSQGLTPETIRKIEKMYGFDKPPHERFWLMVRNYLTFDFGESFNRDTRVIDLIVEKLPVSMSLGLWMLVIGYLVSIPLGIYKAMHDGSRADVWSSAVIVIGYAIPGFLFAVLLIVLFAGGSYFQWFPLKNLTSDNWSELSFFGKIGDYLWHMALPLTAMVVGQFAQLTLLTKNSFLEEVRKQYVLTARAKGLSETQVQLGHVFRNAMLLVISGFPAAFIGAFFAGALLIETIFSLDGLGLLSYESIRDRDYPVVFGTLFIFSLMGLVVNLISDLTYMLIDPRIDFESREV